MLFLSPEFLGGPPVDSHILVEVLIHLTNVQFMSIRMCEIHSGLTVSELHSGSSKALAGVIVLSFRAAPFTHTVPLSTQELISVSTDKSLGQLIDRMLGSNPQWISITHPEGVAILQATSCCKYWSQASRAKSQLGFKGFTVGNNNVMASIVSLQCMQRTQNPVVVVCTFCSKYSYW